MAEEKATKIKKKRWYQVVGPRMFRENILGETLVNDPQLMLNKILKVNLMNLTHEVKRQNVNIKFQINEVKENQAIADVIGYEIIPATIRRFVRRGKKRIDMSFLCETSDKKKVRIKPVAITKKTMKSSVSAAIRKSITDYLVNSIKKMNYNNLVTSLVSHKLQSSLRNHLRKIYPLRICEIREMNIVKEVAPEEKAKEFVKPKQVEKEEMPKEIKKEEVKEEIKEEKPKEVKKEEKKEEVKEETKKEEVKIEKKEEEQKDSKEVKEEKK